MTRPFTVSRMDDNLDRDRARKADRDDNAAMKALAGEHLAALVAAQPEHLRGAYAWGLVEAMPTVAGSIHDRATVCIRFAKQAREDWPRNASVRDAEALFKAVTR
jgi:hypothetical protein